MSDIKEEIVTTAKGLAEFCDHLNGCPVVGLDTEFVGEETYHPSLCLVQVALPGRLVLLDPLVIGSLESFWKLLLDPKRLVVVHAGREEVRLCRLWSGSAPANLFDLQLAAGLVGLPYPMGHGPLVNQLCGARLRKGETLTEWRRRPLTPEQIRYAYDDVRYLLGAHDRLTKRLNQMGRLEWAREEFSRLVQMAAPDDPATEERWRKLKGLGSLDRRKLGVVRSLFAWREERAAQLNRPPRTIVRDDLVIEIARRNPTRLRDLQVVRGLHSRDLEKILAVVLDARALPLELCPELPERDQDPPQLAIVAGVLIAILADWCAREQLAQSLVASNNDVRDLVRARVNDAALPDIPLTRGWRASHVLPILMEALEGRTQVRIATIRADAPLGYTPT
jgi:ribonuclease D